MSTAVDNTIRTDGKRINCIDHRAASVMLPLRTPHESRRVRRVQLPLIAYAGFVASSAPPAQSNPEV